MYGVAHFLNQSKQSVKYSNLTKQLHHSLNVVKIFVKGLKQIGKCLKMFKIV